MHYAYDRSLMIYSFNETYQEGQTSPDNNIGRFIAEAVSSLPKLPPQVFDNVVNDSLQVKKKNLKTFNAKSKHIII